jgi:NADH-quinone oxidoreductase subunit N
MREMVIQLSPQLILLVGVALLLIGEILLKPTSSRSFLGVISMLTVLASALFTILQGNTVIRLFEDGYISDPLIRAVHLLLLLGTLFVIFLSFGEKVAAKGEYYLLLLTAVLGAMTLVSAGELITLFVSLELLSLSGYVLVGLQQNRLISSEAAWKYVIYGGTSSAFLLYGMSFFYGMTGTTNWSEMATALTASYTNNHELLLYLGAVLLLIGVGFKLAAVPFHMWAPDVYQGAPTTVTLFLATVSKIAGFTFALRLFTGLFSSDSLQPLLQQTIVPGLLVLSLLSMIFGNVIALKQHNVKRMLAYSSIGHAGYLLIALICVLLGGGSDAFISLYYYFIAYLLASAGAFAVLHVLTDGSSADYKQFSGLHRRSPWLAFSFTIFVLSLAGIPFTAGFIGKFIILVNAFGNSLYWLLGAMLLTTVISYYYYFRLVRQMYWQKTEESETVAVPLSAWIVIALTLLGTFIFGLVPNVIIEQVSMLFS